MNANPIEAAYAIARARYSALGVDTDAAMAALEAIPISLQCWQGDDVGGFEPRGAPCDGGGIQATGNYPGKARNAEELRADLDCAMSLIPGTHRVNLHACYAETAGVRVERNDLQPEHFTRWMDWAAARGLGLDFNPTFFAHPLANSGFTLSHADAGIRRFWIEHGIACRRIGAAMGRATGTASLVNVWIPDGYKDTPVDRRAPRERLAAALDAVFAERIDQRLAVDAVESKLFGIGSESYVTGSHEFYMGYAARNNVWLCLDAGHFHPTESIADKLSALLLFVPGLLLHVSRGVRWDSDHVVTLTDDLRAIAHEIVRSNALDRIRIGLDYFDAGINRVAAWVIGTRNMLKALLAAWLEPLALLRGFEAEGRFTQRLAMQEELKSYPSAAVWDYYCLRHEVPVGSEWMEAIDAYERDVLAQRG